MELATIAILLVGIGMKRHNNFQLQFNVERARKRL